MKEIEKNYNKSVKAYIKSFEEQTELSFDFWIADIIGEIAVFGDYSFDFSDIKYVVDNSISFEWLSDWYYFVVEYQKCYYNLDAYCRLRRDAEKNKFFNLCDFEKNLLYMRIENDVL